MTDFRFSQTQWTTMLALTAVMLPNDDLPDDLAHGVVSRLEQLLRTAAWPTRLAFRAALFFIEYSTGLLFLEWGRFSRVSVARARSRFERLSHHRFTLFVLLAKLLKSLIQIAIYSDQRVEKHFQNHRREWRRNRFDFRERLLTIGDPSKRPPTPTALADDKNLEAERYLDWDEAKDS